VQTTRKDKAFPGWLIKKKKNAAGQFGRKSALFCTNKKKLCPCNAKQGGPVGGGGGIFGGHQKNQISVRRHRYTLEKSRPEWAGGNSNRTFFVILFAVCQKGPRRANTFSARRKTHKKGRGRDKKKKKKNRNKKNWVRIYQRRFRARGGQVNLAPFKKGAKCYGPYPQ